ncbi:MAG: succinate dehydrogenase assembly factor 2 [Pararhodobacter sp.]|nr:succinate dehydrogenase assembly factor 2 [Pararhodobacter sp.]
MSDDDNTLKRLRMRAWRRGIKEMDLILGPFADTALSDLDAPMRAQFEALLGENDHDLYQWVTARIGQHTAQAGRGPAAYGPLLDRIAAHATTRLAPQ